VFLTFIHVPDVGLSEPKHAVYWHNLGVKLCSVQNKYMLWCVRLCLLLLEHHFILSFSIVWRHVQTFFLSLSFAAYQHIPHFIHVYVPVRTVYKPKDITISNMDQNYFSYGTSIHGLITLTTRVLVQLFVRGCIGFRAEGTAVSSFQQFLVSKSR
jgi:hypothetical protein